MSVLDVASRDVLGRLAADGGSLALALVVTDDGFEVARVPEGQSADSLADGRFASMASSVQALSEAVLRELKMGAGDAVIIQGEAGVVIQARVPGHPLVISAQFRSGETLGKSLLSVRAAVAGLRRALDNPTTVDAP